MTIYQLDDSTPDLHESAWVADSAQVIGNVELAEGANLWFGVIVRGDNETVRIGRNCNVQDATVIHSDPGSPTTLEDNVSIGHQVMLHGCTVGEGSLIGIQSVVLNGARIGRNCLVGAGSLVTEGKEFPDGSMIIGRPARVLRPLTRAEIEGLARIATHYVDNARRFRQGMKRMG